MSTIPKQQVSKQSNKPRILAATVLIKRTGERDECDHQALPYQSAVM